MAETAPSAGGGAMQAITRKVGPLPLWAWAAILVVGFVLYRRMKGGSPTASSSAPTDTSQTDQNTYVPGFDAAGAGGGGGIGSTGTPGVVNNYYYGDQAAQQAAGGGTAATGVPGPTSPSGVMTPGGGISGAPITFPFPTPGTVGTPHGFGPGGAVTPTASTPSTSKSVAYYVPASSQVSHPLNTPVAV